MTRHACRTLLFNCLYLNLYHVSLENMSILAQILLITLYQESPYKPRLQMVGGRHMLYDNIYILSDIFHRFLMDHPDLQDDTASGTEVDFLQRFEDWLERETDVTDLSHKATLLQMVSSYEALVEMRDTLTVSTGL